MIDFIFKPLLNTVSSIKHVKVVFSSHEIPRHFQTYPKIVKCTVIGDCCVYFSCSQTLYWIIKPEGIIKNITNIINPKFIKFL